MRNIKFRAWDRLRNEYLSAGKVLIKVNPGSQPSKPDELYLDTASFVCSDWMVIEQFTGLKESNGVIHQNNPHPNCGREIYAGDVYFVSGLGECSVGIDALYGASFINSEDEFTPIIDCIAENEDIKYIGNIHETGDQND